MTDLKQAIAELAQQLQASLAERDELLLQQAATAEILNVINSSPGNLAPVFEAILEKAMLICGASFGVLSTYEGEDLHKVVAMRGVPSAVAGLWVQPVRLGPETGLGRLVRGENFVHIADASDDEGYRLGNPVRRALVDIAGARTYLAIPLHRDDVIIGAITIYRREVRRFTEKQIALLQTFATQAVLAMENARLFDEVHAKTRDLEESLQQQTATADVLKVISRSAFDLQSVLDTLVTSASTLCSADQGLFRPVCRQVRVQEVARLGTAPGHYQRPGGTRRPYHARARRIERPGIHQQFLAATYRLPRDAGRAPDAAGTADRGHGTVADQAGPVRRPTDRACDDLRRPGGDRHRERPPVQRGAGADP